MDLEGSFILLMTLVVLKWIGYGELLKKTVASTMEDRFLSNISISSGLCSLCRCTLNSLVVYTLVSVFETKNKKECRLYIDWISVGVGEKKIQPFTENQQRIKQLHPIFSPSN